MERTFLKSRRKGISGGADVPHRGEACPDGQILPIPVGFCLLLFGAYDPANCPICTHSQLSLVFENSYSTPSFIIVVRRGHLSMGKRDECTRKINGLGLMMSGNLR
jgi:hypothetical protein